MPVLRFIRVTAPISGDGVPAALGGTPLELDALGITSGYIAAGAVLTDKLENGASSPGNDKYYGTDSGGTKGFFDLPAGGGGGATTTVRLTTTNCVVHIAYSGSTTPGIVENSAGVFTITEATGTELKSIVFEGTSASVSSAMLTLNLVSTDGDFLHFIPHMLRMDTYQPVGLVLQAILPTQDDTTAGTIQSIWSNMNFSPFQLNLTITRKEPTP